MHGAKQRQQSVPLSSILERASVTYLSPGHSPSLALCVPFEVSGTSFAASGTTAHPFLARLRLEWTNGSLNPPLEVDHWVEVTRLWYSLRNIDNQCATDKHSLTCFMRGHQSSVMSRFWTSNSTATPYFAQRLTLPNASILGICISSLPELG